MLAWLALALAAPAAATGGIATGADYLTRCRASALRGGVQGQLLAVTCVSFVNGFVRGAAYAESMKPKPAFCLPPTASTDEMMVAIEATLRSSPTLGPRPIEEVTWRMLAERYRCGL